MRSEHPADERIRAAAAALDETAADPRACVDLDGAALQALFGAATRVFAARREAGDDLGPFAATGPTTAAPTPTDVVVTVSAMLEDASIELFEVGLWQAWGQQTPTRGDLDDER